MRPKKHETTVSGDLFRARLERIINTKHALVQLAGKIDWEWIDGEIAPLYSDKGRPGIETRFVIGLLLLKHIYGLSDEGVCERWVHDPYFQHFSGEEFFQHEFPHERSDLSHWRKRLGDQLELLLAESLRVAHAGGALRTRISSGSRSTPRCSPRRSRSDRCQAAARGDQGIEPAGPQLRRAAAAILLRIQARRHDGGTLHPCQTVQSPPSPTAHHARSAWPHHRHVQHKMLGKAELEAVLASPCRAPQNPLSATAPAGLEAVFVPCP